MTTEVATSLLIVIFMFMLITICVEVSIRIARGRFWVELVGNLITLAIFVPLNVFLIGAAHLPDWGQILRDTFQWWYLPVVLGPSLPIMIWSVEAEARRKAK